MTDSQFDKLYKHMTERFDSLHDEVGDVKREVKGIYSNLDKKLTILLKKRTA